jgi:hypothetical protein
MGSKLLDLEVFVDGQDFTFKAPIPTAFWLGKIMLVDKEPEPEQPIMESVIATPTWEVAAEKEVDIEPEKVSDSSNGVGGSGEAKQSEGTQRLLETATGAEPTKRSRKPRKPKTTKSSLGGRTDF